LHKPILQFKPGKTYALVDPNRRRQNNYRITDCQVASAERQVLLIIKTTASWQPDERTDWFYIAGAISFTASLWWENIFIQQ